MPRPLDASRDTAFLPNYVEQDETFAVFALGGGARVLARARRDGPLRTLDQWSLGPPPRALDRTVFRITDEACAEIERLTSVDGPNLHPAPIVIPARLGLNEPVQVLPGARVILRYCGPAEHLGLAISAIALEVVQGDEARVLWSGQALGEVAIVAGTFAEPGPILRELVGWRCGSVVRFGDVPAPDALPDLPLSAQAGGRPRGVF